MTFMTTMNMTESTSQTKPRFTPSTHSQSLDSSQRLDDPWCPLISCPADFPLELFEPAVSELIHHPEYNSTLILRSETISDRTSDFPPNIPLFADLCILRVIHRKLLARRPGRDSDLEQYCTLYGSSTSEQISRLLVLTPITSSGSPLPYYHPAVSHIAFRYLSDVDPPQLRVDVIPLPDTATDPNSRIYRTCLSLLETLHRYGWGAMTDYKKRVQHDCLIPREAYQDLYLVMRERHKHFVDQWHETTDPLKHVFEDIAIATYLMLLWKDSYPIECSSSTGNTREGDHQLWHAWPRPKGGFLDLGCGNGLLTHILLAEGYEGCGIDVRARLSWSHYPTSTHNHLHVHALDPTASLQDPSAPDDYFKPGVFVIANHADELTPWAPVLSALHSASGYISIPCCAWTFDQRYERSKASLFPVPSSDFVDRLNLGGDGSNSSSYSMYRIWLASLSLHCGWEVECDNLRIPSTRNWAIIGRRRCRPVEGEDMWNAEAIVTNVKDRGVFKPRKPEGKAGDH